LKEKRHEGIGTTWRFSKITTGNQQEYAENIKI